MNVADLQVRVARKAMEAIDISTFELVNVNDHPLPAFSAGSHIDVHLPNGLTRQYSLCNDPSEGHRYLIGVLHDAASRGGSKSMHEQVKVGDVMHISAPRNHFPLAHEATHSILVAGGIGVTPILCMAERLAVTGSSFEMHYCTRSPERTAFRERISGSTFSQRVHFHFDDGPESSEAAAGPPPDPDAPRRAFVRVRPEGLHGLGIGDGPRGGLAIATTALRILRRGDRQVGGRHELRGETR